MDGILGHIDGRGSEEGAHQPLLLLQGAGSSQADAMRNLASQLMEQLCGPSQGAGTPVTLRCHGGTPKQLLLAWVELLLYVVESRQDALAGFEVTVQGTDLAAHCSALPLRRRAKRVMGVLASTAVLERDLLGRWHADCELLLGAGQEER
jgi:hypothetical protein